MGQYYFLVSGLPNLVLDGSKPPFTTAEFRAKLADNLHASDLRLMDYLLLHIDNRNLLSTLQYPGYEIYDTGVFEIGEISELIEHAKDSLQDVKSFEANSHYEIYFSHYMNINPKSRILPFNFRRRPLPAYMGQFALDFLQAAADKVETPVPCADRLSSMYYAYVMKCPNGFSSAWFEFNLNINNINTAITCRKYHLDRELYIVGDTLVADMLRASVAADFDLSRTLDYLPDLLNIADEPDWMQREWLTDRLRWEWLDKQLFPKVFSIDNVIAYLLKLEMMEHWSSLTRTDGEQMLHQIMESLGHGGDHALEEFKRNNK
ncbi:MAG: DUF2764 domain-containing protein [Tannerella sp.]|jgi:hypothetical protein|nr:DUF2764 domain-containing protein [Tannerella sp.]